jgi:L-rhamnose mutarotase
MSRFAYRLRIRPGKEAEYDESHKYVWPELLAKLKEAGISNYSIFRRDLDLVLVLEVEDFDAACRILDNDATNLNWQQKMAPIFDSVPGLKPGERFAMMEEVFRLE